MKIYYFHSYHYQFNLIIFNQLIHVYIKNIIKMEQQIQEKKPVYLGKLDLNLVIKGAQNNNGIKRADYQRYRKYCTTKLKKIRKLMGFKYALKNKFTKKTIEKQKADDSRILQVLLFNAQKNWAHANEVKVIYTSKIKKNKGTRAKFTIIKKLRRSVDWAKKLQQTCQRSSEKKSALQAQAYKEFLQGQLNFQIQNWAESSKCFIKSRSILSELEKVSDSITQGILKEKIDQIQQTIKYCNFKQSKGKQLSINEILQMKKVNDPSLTAKLETLTHTTIDNYTTSDLLVVFGGEKFPIKQEKILKMKQKIDTLKNQLNLIEKACLQKPDDDNLYDSLISFFSEVFEAYDETIKLTDKQKDDAKYTQGQKQILSKISFFFQEERLQKILNRHEKIYLHSYEDSSSQDPIKAKKGAPQTLAKLLTNIIGILNQFNDLQKDKAKLANKPVNFQRLKEIDELSFYYRTLRLHFVAQVYFNNSKLSQAHSLWIEAQRCLYIIKSKQNKPKFIFELALAQKLIKQGKLNTWIAFAEKNQTNLKEMTEGVGNLIIKELQQQDLTLQYLIKNPNLLSKLTLEELSQIDTIELPPKIQMIPCRPIFYDLTDSTLVYPNMDKKVKQEPQSGWFWNKIKIFK